MFNRARIIRVFREKLFVGLIAAFTTIGLLLPVHAQGNLAKIGSSNVDKLKMLSTLTGHTGNVLTLAFSPDGNYLASGSVDTTVRLWNVQNLGAAQQGVVLQGHTKQIAIVGFSADSKTLFTGSYDYTLRTWDVQSGKQTAVQGPPGPRMTNMVNAFNADMSVLVYGQDIGGPGVWDVKKGTALAASLTTDGVSSAGWFAFAPDGQSVYMDDSKANKIYQVPITANESKADERKAVLTGPEDAVYDGPLALSQDGNWLAVETSADGSIHLFDVKAGKLLTTLAADVGGELLLFSPDGSLLVSSATDAIRFWDVKTGKQVSTLAEKDIYVGSFNSSGTMLAIAPPSAAPNDPAKIELWAVPG